jgi:hypothetical protein
MLPSTRLTFYKAYDAVLKTEDGKALSQGNEQEGRLIMATNGNQIRESFVAGADLSSAQFTFVKMDTTDRTVDCCW